MVLMRIVIDTVAKTLSTMDGAGEEVFPLYGEAAFEAVSRQWLRIGWSLRYYHNFSWFGHPVLQLPEDLLRAQEVIYRTRPDVIVETGVFQGGSLTFYASLFQALGHGRVIGVDRELSPQARQTAASHPLAPRIALVEGDSISADVFARVSAMIEPQAKVLVMLDSCHQRRHVARELELYSTLVTPGSYIVAADGVMRDLTDVPGGDAEWALDNPLEAARDFLASHPGFVEEQPPWLSHGGEIGRNVTYWPGAWLKRK